MENIGLTGAILDVIVFLGILYFLPTIICIFNSSNHKLATILINIFFWWTVMGWFIALVLSLQTWNKTIIINNNQSEDNKIKNTTNNEEILEFENKILKEEIANLRNKYWSKQNS